ncbi:OncC [Papillomaviridae sp. Seabass_c1851]|nr:OncC [Papillomaviridae sp. Seabass_c1851]
MFKLCHCATDPCSCTEVDKEKYRTEPGFTHLRIQGRDVNLAGESTAESSVVNMDNIATIKTTGPTLMVFENTMSGSTNTWLLQVDENGFKSVKICTITLQGSGVYKFL